ncbi:hypothetical protein F5Y16DRAFT_395989 [Xylariaceae sp. FL0255]|nr:hypothetical protein F5Y16DRAFT_395989 [Xylariaceae sp. FL0255]
MSSPSTPSTTTTLTGSRPVIRRSATGCSVTLGSSLVPAAITHSDKTVSQALKEGIMEAEKPGVGFAMLLLGAEVSYKK